MPAKKKKGTVKKTAKKAVKVPAPKSKSFTFNTENEKVLITVCRGSGCKSLKAMDIITNLKTEIQNNNLQWEVKQTGCHGFCEAGPVVVAKPFDILYTHVKPEDASEIITTLKQNKLVERLLYTTKNTKVVQHQDLDFYAKQTKYLLRRTGNIDPFNIDEFEMNDGFVGLKTALEKSPEDVVKIVTDSGLRGRGGGGFATGMKWSFIAKAKSEEKYLIANADEGDPGSFMDRTLLEGDPFSVIEGMVIGAYATGCHQGIIYVRAEYPQAVEILENAIVKAREKNYLGETICGKEGFNFDIHLSLGSGAFVCGEETALMNSIEGKRGIPRVRPPFPAEAGLFNKPTNINNVKTFGYVSHILREGIESFRKYGTEKSPGTAVLSLTGKVNNTGIVEIPMGTTLKSLIYDIAGGLKNDKPLKAVMTGGPSGGVIPANMLDKTVDYESLTSAGSIMGSGGVLAFDEDDSMVEVARFFIGFTKSESCGKCTPCREGTYRLYEILDKFMKGEGKLDDLYFTETFCQYIKDSSACGLGQTAPNPVLTTMKYFRNEYEEAIAGILPKSTTQATNDSIQSANTDGGLKKPEPKEKKEESQRDVPKGPKAETKSDTPKYRIDKEKCTGCHSCAPGCPVHCISGAPGAKHKIDESKCIGCGQCQSVCKFDAISKV
jgi:NADH:ubiquinone oxidoreductase subunit F (NADH-binding)/ferredoxin/(2Fe-2S) ferredoxin